MKSEIVYGSIVKQLDAGVAVNSVNSKMCLRSVSDSDLLAEDFVHGGLDHFKAATVLFKAGPSCFDSAGYLAHMSAELLVKAWLLQVAGDFKRIHSVHDLYAELVTTYGATPMSAEHLQTLELLDRYGQLRYPNRAYPTEIGDNDLPMLEDFISHLVNSLPAHLRIAVAKLNPVEKGGRSLMRKKIDHRREVVPKLEHAATVTKNTSE